MATPDTKTTGTSDSKSTGDSYTLGYQGWWLFTFFSSSRQYGDNSSKSRSATKSTSSGASSSRSTSQSVSNTEGWNEAVHKRPLLNPDEIGRFLSRIDERNHPAYPGLLLALMPGQHPLVARRVSYFQSTHFEGLFDPHPNYPPPPTLAELERRAAAQAIWADAQLLEPPEQIAKPPKPRGKLWRRIFIAGALGTVALVILLILAPDPQPSTDAPQSGVAAETAQGASETTPHAAPETAAANPTAFDEGLFDRRIWEDWFNSLTGEEHEGAAFWAGQRSLLNPGTCPALPSLNYWRGCKEAKRYLDPSDRRRLNDPEFRRGWNSY